MVRYSFACRDELAGDKKDIQIEEKEVDIIHGEQLSEHFLCDVNVNGEVKFLRSTQSVLGS